MTCLEVAFRNETYMKIKTISFPSVGSVFKPVDIFYKDKYRTFLDSIALNPTARTVMLTLFRILHTKEVETIHHKTISEETGISSISTIRYHLRNLEHDYFISITRPRKVRGRITQNFNEYSLVWHEYYHNVLRLADIKEVEDSERINADNISKALRLLKDQYHSTRKELQPVIAVREFKKLVETVLAQKKAAGTELRYSEAIQDVSTSIYKHITFLKTQKVWHREDGKYLSGFGNMILKRPWEDKDRNQSLGVEEHRSSQIDILNELI